MTKILMCHTPVATDATSLYRGVGPLSSLRKAMRGDFNYSLNKDVNWATLKAVDGVFLQRPSQPRHVQITEMAQANGKAVWVDYDDNLFVVPKSNRANMIYGKAEVQNAMCAIIAKADVISASTEVLAESIRVILGRIASAPQNGSGLLLDERKIVVVPNAYDLELMTDLIDPRNKLPHQNKLIAWRGSATHDKDLWGVTPQLQQALAKHLDWTFTFIGEPFWMTIEALQEVPGIKPTNIFLAETLDPIEYLAFVKRTAPALMIVPLDDNPFNHCKSNIAWLEATHAGAMCLAPNFPEWRRPGILNYKTAEDFGEKLEAFMRGEIDGYQYWKASAEYIVKELTLEKINRLRERIAMQICEGKPRK